MFKREINNFTRDIRNDLFKAGLAAAESRFEHPARRYEREERKRHCMEVVGKIVCVLLVVVSVLLVADWICKKCGVKKVAQKEISAIEDDHKELYQKLAKIKGRTA